ncbi:hypothetical protein [Actinomadura rayongensis]|uniref:Uncharacterized protein n=1 Tax=Actinomadura rayongensis TaxID=1429076 RepID=A0A6I4W274_9ACTN|nr:hypothetical protein [Actinomadura rayongensis]MXQ62780.1 hypothetical protein [Actinomadura rayongensis]
MTSRIVRRCRRTWLRIGVPAGDVADMTAELAADLAAAEADGRDPDSYVGGDPAGFARAWASERGVVPVRSRVGRLMAAGVLGGLPGALAGLFAVFGLQSETFAQVLGRGDRAVELPSNLLVAAQLAAAFFAWAGILGATSAVLRFHADALRRPTVRALAWVLPAAGVVAAVVVGGAARVLHYPYGTRYVLAEMIAPVVIVAAAVAGTRLGVTRRRRKPPGAETEPGEFHVAAEL